MSWLAILAIVITGLSESGVIMANDTGIPIARIAIDGKWIEGSGGAPVSDHIFLPVTAQKHHLRVVFRGGADVDWPDFNFKGIHEIIFERKQNHIQARVE